jgi:hypothetical protein
VPNHDRPGSVGRANLERQIGDYLCQGYTSKEIARLVGKWPSGKPLEAGHVHTIVRRMITERAARGWTHLAVMISGDAEIPNVAKDVASQP